MEHLLHIFSNSCGEGSAALALVSEAGVIRVYLSRLLLWARTRKSRL